MDVSFVGKVLDERAARNDNSKCVPPHVLLCLGCEGQLVLKIQLCDVERVGHVSTRLEKVFSFGKSGSPQGKCFQQLIWRCTHYSNI